MTAPCAPGRPCGSRRMTDPGMDIHALAERLDLDEASCRELLKIFVEESRKDLERMRAALATADCGGVAEAAHSLRGAAGNLDLKEIMLLADKLERGAGRGSLDNSAGLIGELIVRLENLAGEIVS
jgi:HPt (histidine-containing phosphotransfer) domain-containing protein